MYRAPKWDDTTFRDIQGAWNVPKGTVAQRGDAIKKHKSKILGPGSSATLGSLLGHVEAFGTARRTQEARRR